jgi:acyl carrier protein phosphodiesterase
MNLLAHLWLADRSRTSAAGQLLGDVVKGRLDRSRFTPAIDQGIRLHRLIDSRCDAHNAHQGLRQSFDPPLRRYAGIVVDIGFDHALARNWAQFSAEPLAQFTERLAGHVLAEWPPEAPVAAPRPAAIAAVLSSYAGEYGIERALTSTGSRMRQPNPLHRALPALLARYQDFKAGLPRLLNALETEILNYANHDG